MTENGSDLSRLASMYPTVQAAAKAIGRPRLDEENREGVTHLITGQHWAKCVLIEGEELLELSYVALDGHSLVAFHVSRETGDLQEDRTGFIVKETGIQAIKFPSHFNLSDDMRAAVDLAIENDPLA